MSKKNNKARKKKYIEMIKQIERDNEEESKRKKAMKLAKISTNKLIDEIEDFELDDKKGNEMEVEKKETKHHKKTKFRMKHGRYS